MVAISRAVLFAFFVVGFAGSAQAGDGDNDNDSENDSRFDYMHGGTYNDDEDDDDDDEVCKPGRIPIVYMLSFYDKDGKLQTYVGSTLCEALRMGCHKSNWENKTDMQQNLYKYAEEGVVWEDITMRVLEYCPDTVITKRELNKYEQAHMNKENPTLNDRRAYTTLDQRRADQRASIARRFEANPEYVREK
jgi:hypothetical protein